MGAHSCVDDPLHFKHRGFYAGRILRVEAGGSQVSIKIAQRLQSPLHRPAEIIQPFHLHQALLPSRDGPYHERRCLDERFQSKLLPVGMATLERPDQGPEHDAREPLRSSRFLFRLLTLCLGALPPQTCPCCGSPARKFNPLSGQCATSRHQSGQAPGEASVADEKPAGSLHARESERQVDQLQTVHGSSPE